MNIVTISDLLQAGLNHGRVSPKTPCPGLSAMFGAWPRLEVAHQRDFSPRASPLPWIATRAQGRDKDFKILHDFSQTQPQALTECTGTNWGWPKWGIGGEVETRCGRRGAMPMAWDVPHHLTPLQLGQGSHSHREFLTELPRLCQGGDEEILGWGALCAPALPTSPFLQQHALERGQGILVPGSPLSPSAARSRVTVGKWSLPEFSRGRRLFGTEGLVLLRCQGSGSSCLCARKIILFM